MAGYSKYNVSLGNSKSQIDFLKKLGVKLLENLDLNSFNEGAAGRELKKASDVEVQEENLDLVEKETQNLDEEVKKQTDLKDPISIDLKDLNLKQAFVYSEIFGKPKCKRNNRW